MEKSTVWGNRKRRFAIAVLLCVACVFCGCNGTNRNVTEGVTMLNTLSSEKFSDEALQNDEYKAAAVTYIGLGKNAYSGETPKKIEIFLDRPFVYMLVDDSTNLPLFVGVVNTL